MPDFNYFLKKNIENIKQNDLYRELTLFDGEYGAYCYHNGEKILQLSSNNYLGLACDNSIKNAVIDAVSKYGVGSTASRLVCGTHRLHYELEDQIAALKSTESAMVYSSGYSANLGALSAILTKDDAVYSDELNHASIIDGIRLSGCNKFIYKHCDTPNLEELLAKNHHKYRLNIIVTDSIFSMDGDRAPLNDIVSLKAKYGAVLFVDEAHAFGLYGEQGQGLAHELGINNHVDIQMGTLSKAAGCEGGYIAGTAHLIEFLRNKSRAFIFSTAPTISSVAAAKQAISLIKNGHDLRKSLYSNIDFLRLKLKQLENKGLLELGNSGSAIFSIKIGDTQKTLKIAKQLFEEYGIFATAIRPPTVKTSRIRVCTMATHSKEDLEKFVIALTELLA